MDFQMHDVQILDAFLSDLKTSRESRIVMDPESSNILILKDEDLNPVQDMVYDFTYSVGRYRLALSWDVDEKCPTDLILKTRSGLSMQCLGIVMQHDPEDGEVHFLNCACVRETISKNTFHRWTYQDDQVILSYCRNERCSSVSCSDCQAKFGPQSIYVCPFNCAIRNYHNVPPRSPISTTTSSPSLVKPTKILEKKPVGRPRGPKNNYDASSVACCFVDETGKICGMTRARWRSLNPNAKNEMKVHRSIKQPGGFLCNKHACIELGLGSRRTKMLRQQAVNKARMEEPAKPDIRPPHSDSDGEDPLIRKSKVMEVKPTSMKLMMTGKPKQVIVISDDEPILNPFVRSSESDPEPHGHQTPLTTQEVLDWTRDLAEERAIEESAMLMDDIDFSLLMSIPDVITEFPTMVMPDQVTRPVPMEQQVPRVVPTVPEDVPTTVSHSSEIQPLPSVSNEIVPESTHQPDKSAMDARDKPEPQLPLEPQVALEPQIDMVQTTTEPASNPITESVQVMVEASIASGTDSMEEEEEESKVQSEPTLVAMEPQIDVVQTTTESASNPMTNGIQLVVESSTESAPAAMEEEEEESKVQSEPTLVAMEPVKEPTPIPVERPIQVPPTSVEPSSKPSKQPRKKRMQELDQLEKAAGRFLRGTAPTAEDNNRRVLRQRH